MLTYEDFKKEFKARLPFFMGNGYDDYVVKTFPVNKRGVKKDGFSFCRENAKYKNGRPQIMPVLYYDDFYKDYLMEGSIDLCLIRASSALKEGYKAKKKLTTKIDIKNASDRIIFQLINTEENRSLLADVPSREFLDLSIIYRWAIMVDKHGISSTVIDNDIAEAMGFDEKQLYDLAFKNTKDILPYKITDFDEIMAGMMRDDGLSEEEIKGYLEDGKDCGKMLMITNECSVIGASAILYPNILRRISKMTGGDFYILPSSVNEVFAVSASFNVLDGLADVVRKANLEVTDITDVLSDNIYYYSCSSEELYMMSSAMKA